LVDSITCRYRGWTIRIRRRLADGRWAASVEMRQSDRDTDQDAVTLPFTETFATAPAAAAAALEAAIIWIDRAGQSVS
jgi:hypothetical protein